MSFSMMVSNRIFAEGHIETVSLQPGMGFYRLAFNLKLQVAAVGADFSEELTEISVDVRFSGSSQLPRLHPAPGQLPLKSQDYGQSRFIQLEMDLSPHQLEALEVARNGGDVPLQLTYNFALKDLKGNAHYSQSSDGQTISQSDWIRILKDARFSKITLLEVPSFDTNLSPALASASTHLQKAHESLLRGEYRASVGCCRDVLEALELALHDKEDLNVEVARSRELDKAGRIRMIRNAAKVFTHAARHEDEVAALFEWTRVDATFIISIATTLLWELTAPGAIGQPLRATEVISPEKSARPGKATDGESMKKDAGPADDAPKTAPLRTD